MLKIKKHKAPQYNIDSLYEYFIECLKYPSYYSKKDLCNIARRAVVLLEGEEKEYMIAYAQSSASIQKKYQHYSDHIDVMSAPVEKYVIAWFCVGLITALTSLTFVWGYQWVA